ncbi:MAG TPA: 2-phospho-L-lactate guanylyltransferase [Candidatus Bathyarchaeia archaeon]|nr:2-phospho-L-lactate guanylyltransferase [Candidatus Bathyarchaeia archaeon]
MFVYAVVPVKSLGASKNRLSSVLSPQERSQLTLAMLEDVLSALQTSTVDDTVVVSNDLTVHDVVGKFGAMYLAQKTSGLNSAIEEATEWCVQEGAEAVLVLPADIPLLSSADVDRIVELGNCEEQTVVLSPSYDGGTNALFQSPPNLIRVCFGPRSFAEHIKEAQSKGICVRLHYSTSVATDIDSAEDLSKLLKTESNTACRRVLGQFNMGSRVGEVVSPSKSL